METPDLSTKLVEILSQIQGAVTTGSDFVLSQLPDIVQQYVMYGRISTILTTVVFMGLLVLPLWFNQKLNKWLKTEVFDEGFFFGYALCLIGYGVFGYGLYHHLSQALLVWLAPKIWLIQAIAYLVK